MTLAILLIGVIILVAAFRDTQGSLFSALGTDVPQFVVWAAAIVALGVIGFIPGLKPVSRGLLALVLVVIIMRNYQGILAGFQNAWQSSDGTSSNSASNTTGTASQPVPLTIHVPTPAAPDYNSSFGAAVGQ